jgi:hypothetical protein
MTQIVVEVAAMQSVTIALVMPGDVEPIGQSGAPACLLRRRR